MADLTSSFTDHLFALLDKRYTPEKALQLFSESCFSHANYSSKDGEPVLIFLAYVTFIMKALPSAHMDGIWEDILKKTVVYSQNYRGSLKEALSKFSHSLSWDTIITVYTKILPDYDSLETETTWLNEALRSHINCPNPYIRLILFRILMIFWKNKRLRSQKMDWESICITFVHTISEIKPHHLYPSGNEDEVLFDVVDFRDIISECCRNGKLKQLISNEIVRQFKENGELAVNSKKTRFLLHCIQLIGIYSVLAGSNPDPEKCIIEIAICWTIFRENIGELVHCVKHKKGRRSPWDQFLYIAFLPPFHPYVVEAIHDLTTAIINNKKKNVAETRCLLHLRDTIAGCLDACIDTCDLPRLLLSREVLGPMVISQKSLYLREMVSLYTPRKVSDSDGDISYIPYPETLQTNDSLDNSESDGNSWASSFSGPMEYESNDFSDDDNDDSDEANEYSHHNDDDDSDDF